MNAYYDNLTQDKFKKSQNLGVNWSIHMYAEYLRDILDVSQSQLYFSNNYCIQCSVINSRQVLMLANISEKSIAIWSQ